MSNKSREQARIDKEFTKIVANIGNASIRADAPEAPHTNPAEPSKLSTWQYTKADIAADQKSDLAWSQLGLAETDVVEPLQPQSGVEGTGQPKYLHVPADDHAHEQAEFAHQVHDDLNNL